MALIPRKAVQSPWERTLLDDSVDRISAEVVTCYPPGIPILYPGEVISQETVEYLHVIRRLAFGISGPEDRTLTTLRVVKES
jgi:lysine decarboxylase